MPLSEDDVSRLCDVVVYARKVMAMVEGLSLDAFLGDDTSLFAVCYGIQIVGEAVWKLSDEVKAMPTTIPWPLIAGMRHRLVHDYGRTDETVVYRVATEHLPDLVEKVQAILEADGSGD